MKTELDFLRELQGALVRLKTYRPVLPAEADAIVDAIMAGAAKRLAEVQPAMLSTQAVELGVDPVNRATGDLMRRMRECAAGEPVRDADDLASWAIKNQLIRDAKFAAFSK